MTTYIRKVLYYYTTFPDTPQQIPKIISYAMQIAIVIYNSTSYDVLWMDILNKDSLYVCFGNNQLGLMSYLTKQTPSIKHRFDVQ